jgi:hypothetical protein
LNIETILASEAPEALTSYFLRTNPEWDTVQQRVLDAKRGDWLRILLTELPGKSAKHKQGNLQNAMAARKLPVRTRILGAHVWFQAREPKKPKTPAAK